MNRDPPSPSSTGTSQRYLKKTWILVDPPLNTGKNRLSEELLMSHSTLKSIIFLLQGAMPVLLLAVVITLGILVIRFRRSNRRGHVVRFSASVLLLGGCAVALSLAIPREYVARRELDRAERYKKSAIVGVADPVPSFEVADIDGREFSTDDLRGKVLVINFFATWCGPCKLELPHLAEVFSDYQSHQDFRLIVIGRGETQEVIREFRKKLQLAMPMAADPDQAIYQLFADGGSIPRTIVVSPTGTIAYAKEGFYERDISVIRKLIKRYL